MARVILHVEDEPDDALFVGLAVKKANVGCTVHRVSDGRAAVEYLSGKGVYTDRVKYPLPELVLLDLKLPLMSGFEVLQWARSRAEYRSLPIVILSGSDLEDDLLLARRLGATSYLVKSPLCPEVVQLVRDMLTPAELSLDASACSLGQVSSFPARM